MWIEEKTTNSGISYKYNERYTDPQTGKIKRISVTLPTKTRAAIKQATQMLQDKIERKINSARIDEKSVECVVEEWLNYRAISVKPSTLYGIKNQLAAFTRGLPDGLLVSRLDLATVQGIITSMQARKMSRAYVVKILRTVKQMMRYATKMKYVANIDFLDDVDVQYQAKTREEVERENKKYLDKETLKAVLDDIKAMSPRIGLACEFQSLTGVRYGELAALRVQDYDAKSGVIDINGTFSSQVRPEDSQARGTPKTAASYRKIKLNARAKHILDTLITENYQRAHWYSGYTDQGYIFTTGRGNPINAHEVGKVLRRLSFPFRITTHVFRHTHISMLLEAGVPIRTVMQRVGHSTMKTTLEIYAHVSKAAQDDAVVKLDDFLKKQA